jgi:hypothetical protein
MLVATNGESGNAADFDSTEPQAQEAEARISTAAPNGSTVPSPLPRDDTSKPTPTKPSSNPAITCLLGRGAPRAHSSPTIQIGATAISTAASPDGTLCSAQATLALPPSSRNPPITNAGRQCRKAGAGSPRQRAQA